MGYLEFRKRILNKLLLKACKKNKLGLVKFIIFWGADKHVRFVDENIIDLEEIYNTKSLIQVAYEDGAIDVAKYLINNSSYISEYELQRSCRFGNLEIVKCLVEKICKVDKTYIKKTDENGYTILDIACRYNREDIVYYLLDLLEKRIVDLDINKTSKEGGCNALMFACRNVNLEVVKSLLLRGGEISKIIDGRKYIMKDFRGYTPLMCLFESSKYELNEYDNVKGIIDCLLNKEYDLLNCKDASGQSALMHAISSGNIKAARYLIEKGASINDVDNEGENALFFAISKNMFDILPCLIECDKKNEAFIYAVNNGNTEIVRYLIDNGAEIDFKDSQGQYALIHAIKNEDREMVSCLIENGSNIYEKIGSKTSLMYAVENKNIDIVKILVQAHLDRGETRDKTYLKDILGYAFRTKDQDMINFLEYVYCKDTGTSEEFVHKYEDLFDLFDYLNLDKSKILDLAHEKEEFKHLTGVLPEGSDVKTVINIYYVIKNINKNIRRFIASGEKENLIKSIDNQKQKNFGGELKNGRMIRYWNQIKYILKFPYIAYRRLFNKLLIKAVKNSSLFLAKMSLFFGADINMQHEKYNILAKTVCETDNLEMLNFLIDRGLDLKREDELNKTVTNYAIDSGNVDVVLGVMNMVGKEYLANKTDAYGRTYLMYAIKRGNVEIVREFIKIGSSIEITDKWCNKAFQYAYDNKDVLEYLLEISEDVNIKNIFGQSILDDIISNERCNDQIDDVVKLLIEKGVYLNKNKMTKCLDIMFKKSADKIKSEIDKKKSKLNKKKSGVKISRENNNIGEERNLK